MAQWFVPTVSDRHGNRAEEKVLSALHIAVSQRANCDVHAQFPISSHHVRVPDYLMLDREMGLILIEVKGLLSAQIESIAGDCWRVRNYFNKREINPHQQAAHALNMLCEQGPAVSPPRRICIALPYITEAEWRLAGRRVDSTFLFKEHLGAGLLEQLRKAPSFGASAWTEAGFLTWQSHLGGRVREDPEGNATKGEVARMLDGYVASRDTQLRGDAIDVPNGVYRVRGVAGSGKTTLLAQSAAWMLFNNPSSRIAFVYHMRSLFDHCFSLVTESLQKLADSRGLEVVFDRREGKIGLAGEQGAIRVFNAWGGSQSCGFYSFMCSQVGCKPTDLDRARDGFRRRFKSAPGGSDLLPYLCLDLLEQHEDAIQPYFDAVFIDEAQDLITDRDDLRYDGREPFFWLAYRSLKPVNNENPIQRRLIFAYDEAQSLGTLHIPSARKLFGEEFASLFVGGRNRIMRCAFRNPKPILIAAHVLGMGFLRTNGAVQGLTANEWKAIGYEVDGNLRSGSMVTLSRSDENSPNPVPRKCHRDSIAFTEHDSVEAEIEALRRALWRDIHNHHLRPSRDLMVICLRPDAEKVKRALEAPRADRRQIRCFLPGAGKAINEFWREGEVTVTNIWSAKGNEAPMVYVLGLETLAETTDGVGVRNRFFVALTRAQAWVSLSGVAGGPIPSELFDEVRKVAGMVQSTSSSMQFCYRVDRHFRNLDHEEQTELAFA